jgi:hypothetical protein
MADETRRPSLKDFDPYTDRNGQDLGQDSPLDVGLPQHTQTDLRRDPGGEAEAARIASGLPGEDATDATEAETPPDNLRKLKGESSPAEEAIERATAAVGQDDGKR